MQKKVAVTQDGKQIYSDISVAADFYHRFIGLMGKKLLNEGEGLLLKKCSSIHTCFMHFPIDVIYLDRDFRVLYCETVYPWRLGKLVKGACHILELPEGSGMRLKRNEPIEVDFRTEGLGLNKQMAGKG